MESEVSPSHPAADSSDTTPVVEESKVRVLLAEDDAVLHMILVKSLESWGYEVIKTKDGTAAWEVLQQPNAPSLAILDWMMPGMEGIEICRRVRQDPERASLYLILLTARSDKAEVIEGLKSGANDYVTKPFDREELRARVEVGARMVRLQTELARRVKELEYALSEIKQLEGLLPICSYCKKIRDDRNYWQEVEGYIMDHSKAMFSHGICPTCYEKTMRQVFGENWKDKVDPSAVSPGTPAAGS